MDPETGNQIRKWLKKLEQESWQLELLVSAFTIFLLISAISSYSDYLEGFTYEYNLKNSFISLIYAFLIILNLSIRVLTIFLVIHLLLRGFWIGAIGLRSVQSDIDFHQLN
jgi:polyferredoxin